ncbi:MAG: hypothetical protein IJZ59_00105 [Alphaproteobacteria bacterium]|nr:hypothetical protein [Alphaproteobacteria bacterium]
MISVFSAPMLVMMGIAYVTISAIFYIMWRKYTKSWTAVFMVCSAFSVSVGVMSQIIGIIAIFKPHFPLAFLPADFQLYMFGTAGLLFIIWWIPWIIFNWEIIKKNALKELQDIKKNKRKKKKNKKPG